MKKSRMYSFKKMIGLLAVMGSLTGAPQAHSGMQGMSGMEGMEGKEVVAGHRDATKWIRARTLGKLPRWLTRLDWSFPRWWCSWRQHPRSRPARRRSARRRSLKRDPPSHGATRWVSSTSDSKMCFPSWWTTRTTSTSCPPTETSACWT